jgi:hypothetical protein
MIAPYAQAFVDRPCVQFTYDGIPINPHMSLGLIKDLYARDEDSLYIRVVKPDHEMPDRADWLLQVSKDTWKNSSKEVCARIWFPPPAFVVSLWYYRRSLRCISHSRAYGAGSLERLKYPKTKLFM